MLDLILFDDEIAREWEPFTSTRPVGELLFGVMTLRRRAERLTGSDCIGHLAGEHLLGFDEPGASPVIDPDAIGTDRPRLLLLSRFVPAWESPIPAFREEGPVTDATGSVIGWFAPPGTRVPDPASILGRETQGARSAHPIAGSILERPWDLVVRNPDQVAHDISALFPPPVGTKLPQGVLRWGEHPLVVDTSSVIEPGSAFDTSKGPIWLDRDTEVHAFTRLAGPAYIGPGSILLGGAIEAVSLGPMCRVRGELAETVCLGYTNKQHDGHMGHGYLGRWVNLGAGTTNSDLKNNYGSIRMWTPGGQVDTGLMKIGTLMGDHVKTGIGLLLNTGTVLGAGSNIFGTEMPPTYVPPFSWGSGDDLSEYRIDKFLEVAERAMGRRGVDLSESAREQLERAWRRARAEQSAGNEERS